MLGLLHKIKLTADNIQLNSIVGKSVLDRVKEKLFERFSIQDYHLAASVLDPNMKSLSELDEYYRNVVGSRRALSKKSVLHHFYNKFQIEDNQRNESQNPVPRSPLPNRNAPVSSLDSNLVLSTRQDLLDFFFENEEQVEEEPCSTFDSEIDMYLKTKVKGKILSTVDWWKQHEMEFPRLKRLHDAFLNIPPSSASSERAFKKSSKLLRHDRANLSPLKVNMICFINFNIEIIEEHGNIFNFEVDDV